MIIDINRLNAEIDIQRNSSQRIRFRNTMKKTQGPVKRQLSEWGLSLFKVLISVDEHWKREASYRKKREETKLSGETTAWYNRFSPESTDLWRWRRLLMVIKNPQSLSVH